MKIYVPKKRITEDILKNIKVTASDYNQKDLYERTNKSAIYGDIIQTWKKYGLNKPTLAFCINIEHSQKLAETFIKHGIKAAHADKDTVQSLRLDLIENLRHGKSFVLCNVNIFSTGIDIPQIEVGILARPTLSEVLFIQQIGRLLRNAPNKKEAIILDNAGNCTHFGHPYMFREPKMTDLPKGKKIETIKKTHKACPKCEAFILIKLLNCPYCKYEFITQRKIKKIDDTLVEWNNKKQDKKQSIYNSYTWYMTKFLVTNERNKNSVYYFLAKRYGEDCLQHLKELGCGERLYRIISFKIKRNKDQQKLRI